MKHLFTKIFLFHLLLIGAVQVTAQNKKSGNPILPGFHADPEVMYSHQTKRYYIYPTRDSYRWCWSPAARPESLPRRWRRHQ